MSGVGRSSSSKASACSSKTGTHYGNTSNICTGTAYYGLSSTCFNLESTAFWVAQNSFARYWNGSNWSGPCESCGSGPI